MGLFSQIGNWFKRTASNINKAVIQPIGRWFKGAGDTVSKAVSTVYRDVIGIAKGGIKTVTGAVKTISQVPKQLITGVGGIAKGLTGILGMPLLLIAGAVLAFVLLGGVGDVAQTAQVGFRTGAFL